MLVVFADGTSSEIVHASATGGPWTLPGRLCGSSIASSTADETVPHLRRYIQQAPRAVVSTALFPSRTTAGEWTRGSHTHTRAQRRGGSSSQRRVHRVRRSDTRFPPSYQTSRVFLPSVQRRVWKLQECGRQEVRMDEFHDSFER